ncbi:MAG: sugar ABC transporter substrate-binding protein [Acidimicrobiia bacterium]
MRLGRWGHLLAIVGVGAVLLTACEGGETPARGVVSGDADVAGAAAQLDRYRALPLFVPPGPAFGAAEALSGKTIFEIPITSEVPFITAVEEGMRQAAALVGARFVVYSNQGEPTQWAQGISAAIAQKADAITLFAQNPRLLGPAIRQAEEAGIPVVVVRATGEDEPCPADPSGRPYGTTCIPGPFEQAGRLEADWVIYATDGHGEVLVVTSSDATSTVSLLAGMKDEFATRCPDCRVRYVDVPIPQWADRVQTEVTSALLAHPGIDYVIPIYDSMSRYVQPAILAAGAADRVRIATFNGTPFVLEMLQDSDVVQMDVGENLAWVGWATMDQVFRLLTGVGPVRSGHTPLRVFDDANVGEAGRPPRLDEGYGRAFVAGYQQLWGVAG